MHTSLDTRKCAHLRYSICKKFGIETAENWYIHIYKAICEHKDVTVLWRQDVKTDRFWSIGQM